MTISTVIGLAMAAFGLGFWAGVKFACLGAKGLIDRGDLRRTDKW